MFVFGSAYLRHIMSQLIGKCKGKRPCVYDFDNFIVGINFFQGLWGCLKYFWKFRRGGGGGGVNYVSQKWKFRGGEGVHTKFPPWWGYGSFLEPHNRKKCLCKFWGVNKVQYGI